MPRERHDHLIALTNEQLDTYIEKLDDYLDHLEDAEPDNVDWIAEVSSQALDAHDERFYRMGLIFDNIIEVQCAIDRIHSDKQTKER